MDYNKYKRRAKRRITGRFYAFLTVVVVLGVMLGVFLGTRGAPNPPNYLPPVAAFGEATPAPQTNSQTPQPSNPLDEIQADSKGLDAQQGEVPQEEQSIVASDIMTIGTDDEELPELSEADRVKVDNLHAREDLPKDWRNILLLGSDTRDMKKVSRSRTDTIIIASINTQTGQIKLASIMRDMMVEIPGKGLQKFNNANYFGGPELVMRLINENLGMNITEYAIVNFAGMSNIVDILDGVFVDITEEEKDVINQHIGEIARYTMEQDAYKTQKSELLMKNSGPSMRLTGMQAVTYARIRMIGNGDYERTQRQRRVLQAIVDRVKDASVIQLTQIATGMWGYFHTNIGKMNAIGLAQTVLKNGISADKIKDWRMPGKDSFKSETRNKVSALWDVDYGYNTRKLHLFIYGSEFD